MVASLKTILDWMATSAVHWLNLSIAFSVFSCFCCHWKAVLETYCIRVCPIVSECVTEWLSAWVNLCVLKTMWTPYLKNQWKFHPVVVRDVFGFIDMLIRYSQVRITAGIDPKTGWMQYLRKYVHQIWFIHVPAPETYILGQRSRSQQPESTVDGSPSSSV